MKSEVVRRLSKAGFGSFLVLLISRYTKIVYYMLFHFLSVQIFSQSLKREYRGVHILHTKIDLLKTLWGDSLSFWFFRGFPYSYIRS